MAIVWQISNSFISLLLQGQSPEAQIITKKVRNFIKWRFEALVSCSQFEITAQLECGNSLTPGYWAIPLPHSITAWTEPNILDTPILTQRNDQDQFVLELTGWF